MKAKSCLKAIGIAAGVMGVLVLGFLLRFPPDPHVNCHKVLGVVLDELLLGAHTNAFPNINGDERASFAVINDYYHFREGADSLYGYVPGLQRDDPKELVMIYLKKMTRRTWNGDHSASIFTKKKWFIGGPDYWWNPDVDHGLPEGGQVVDTSEFKRRLQMTLDFLKENNRPHWENVVKEHTTFLESIDE